METDALHEALKGALAKVDNNQSRFAAAIGSSQQLVSYWLKKGRPLPAEYVLPAEAAGLGSRHQLRPDIYPNETSLPDDELTPVPICELCDEPLPEGALEVLFEMKLARGDHGASLQIIPAQRHTDLVKALAGSVGANVSLVDGWPIAGPPPDIPDG